MLESSATQDKQLLDLCLDVIYNSNMKALGLYNLAMLYADWQAKQQENEEEEVDPLIVTD